jgi:hypothetical protein
MTTKDNAMVSIGMQSSSQHFPLQRVMLYLVAKNRLGGFA